MSLSRPRLSWPSDITAQLAADWCPRCGVYGDDRPCRNAGDQPLDVDHPERKERAEAKRLYAGREGERLVEEAREREALARSEKGEREQKPGAASGYEITTHLWEICFETGRGRVAGIYGTLDGRELIRAPTAADALVMFEVNFPKKRPYPGENERSEVKRISLVPPHEEGRAR